MIISNRTIAIASVALLTGCSGVNRAVSQSISERSLHADSKTQPPAEVSQQLPPQSTAKQDFLVVPGERVGAVTRETSRDDLTALFGESKLRDRTIWGPEGIGRFSATQVNLGRDKSFTVVWTDTTRTRPSLVQDLGNGWKTAEGIGVGTSFAELRKKLGEFQLYGLNWDYSGTVTLLGTKLSNYYGKLILQVQAAPNASVQFPNDYMAVSGDKRLASTDPHWRSLGMKVGDMTVVLNPAP